MPYITEQRRQLWQSGELNLSDANVGDLNYLITTLVDEYLDERGVSYENINNLVGVFECAKMELYRRIAAPYEDNKKEQNGDVYSV